MTRRWFTAQYRSGRWCQPSSRAVLLHRSPRLFLCFTLSFIGLWQPCGSLAVLLQPFKRPKRSFCRPKWKINYSTLCSALLPFRSDFPSCPDLLLMKLKPVYVNILFWAFAAILGGKRSVILWNQVNTKLCSKLVGEVPREVEQRDTSELLMIPHQTHREPTDAQGFKASKVWVSVCRMQWKPRCEQRFQGAALTSVILTLSQAWGRQLWCLEGSGNRCWFVGFTLKQLSD